ncbi:MAG: SGNH/GDSL hydrolase family protein [Acidimicrobiales bacterium]
MGATSVDHGYVGRLAEALQDRATVLNLSASGAKISDVLDRQLPTLERLGVEPAVVTVTVGSNDLLRGLNPATHAARMRRLVEVLPVNAVVATLPDHGSMLARRLSAVVRASGRERGVAVADVSAEMAGWRGKMAPDGFHPNDAGYDAWVRAFLPAVSEKLG